LKEIFLILAEDKQRTLESAKKLFLDKKANGVFTEWMKKITDEQKRLYYKIVTENDNSKQKSEDFEILIYCGFISNSCETMVSGELLISWFIKNYPYIRLLNIITSD